MEAADQQAQKQLQLQKQMQLKKQQLEKQKMQLKQQGKLPVNTESLNSKLSSLISEKVSTLSERGDFWDPDPEKDRKLGGPGANQRAREDRAAASKPKEDPKKLRPGESYMEYAKRRARGESYVPGKPAEKLGAVTAIPQSERDAAKARLLAKTAAKRKEREMQEAAPPGAKYERMVKHIKKGYSKDGLTDKEKGIAFATAWKAYNKEEFEIEEGMHRDAKTGEVVNKAVPGKTYYPNQPLKKTSVAIEKEKKMKEELEIEEGMTMKDFKANRRKLKRQEASADAKKRGHVGKEWYNSGRTYSPDEAKRSRENMQDHERRTRHRSAVDPDNEDDNNYSADKTKNPKKLRKQKAMGEALSFSNFMEARRMDKEGVDRGDSRRAERAEKARASLAAKAKRQSVLDKHEKKTGTKLDISRSKEGREHAKNFPGSRQQPKERGRKETPSETQNRRINASNQRKIKHGFTSKERKEAESMAKHTSRFD